MLVLKIRGNCGLAGEDPNPHTYQFQQLGAHDLHRENAVGAAPDGGSTILPQRLQILPALSRTGQVDEQEDYLFCWALETHLCAFHSLSSYCK
jgi:hypothetical protein